MRIYFDEIELAKGQPKKIQFSFPLMDLMDENRDILEISEALFSGEAKLVTGLIVVTGNCSFVVQFSCARCLNQFQQSFEVPFHEQFARGLGTAAKEEDEEIHWIDGESFDLIPYCKETMILALPYIPVCKEDCKGLCSECGSDLNVAPCSCKRERIDPRFADLAKLLNQDQE